MTTCQILKFPVHRTLLHILKQYHLRCAIKSPTLSILSPHICNFSPCSTVRKAFFMSGKASYHCFLQSHTNHRAGRSSWQPITKLQLTSLATEQTVWWTAKREGCHLSQDPGMGILHHDASEGLPKQLWMIYWDGK